MQYLDTNRHRGDLYLVDLGKLVPVLATSPHDAYSLASLSVFGPGQEMPATAPILYRLNEAGEVLEVVQ